MSAATDFDEIVSHHAVSAHDQFEGCLGLADAALAEQEDADAEHVHEHAVNAGRR